MAWGGIEPPTRGFSIPANTLHYVHFMQQIKDLQTLKPLYCRSIPLWR